MSGPYPEYSTQGIKPLKQDSVQTTVGIFHTQPTMLGTKRGKDICLFPFKQQTVDRDFRSLNKSREEPKAAPLSKSPFDPASHLMQSKSKVCKRDCFHNSRKLAKTPSPMLQGKDLGSNPLQKYPAMTGPLSRLCVVNASAQSRHSFGSSGSSGPKVEAWHTDNSRLLPDQDRRTGKLHNTPDRSIPTVSILEVQPPLETSEHHSQVP